MTADSRPPSTPCALLLQRKLMTGDCAKWRTVLRLQPDIIPPAATWLQAAAQIDPQVQWRLTDATGREALAWVGDRWVTRA